MNVLTQEAKKKQVIVKYAERNGKSQASRMYGVSLSSVKRWCKRYDGTWQSMLEKSHRPNKHPKRHTEKEERQIKNSFKKCYARYGDGMECMKICFVKVIQEAFREWYMQPKD